MFFKVRLCLDLPFDHFTLFLMFLSKGRNFITIHLILFNGFDQFHKFFSLLVLVLLVSVHETG